MKRSTFFLYFIAFSAATGGFLFGYDTAVISGTISFVTSQFGLSAAQEGWFVSSALIGCIGGALVAGDLADRFGRRFTLKWAGLLFLISALGCMLATSFNALIAFRIIGGVGVGIASMVAPLYISEVSPATIRGRMVALYQFAITIGILMAYFSNAFLLNINGKYELSGVSNQIINDEIWRGMFGSEAIPAIIFISILFLVPRSPRWLIANNREQRSLEVLRKISGKNADKEIQIMKESISNESRGSFKDIFKPGIRTAILVGVILAILSQITGINAIIYYGPKILEEAGFKIGDALGGQVVIGLCNAVFTILAILTIDKLGRKKLMKSGVTIMMVSLLIVSFLFYTGRINGLGLLISILVFIMAFAYGYGPVIWVLLSEIYPNRIRGRAMSVATLSIWLGTAFIGQIVPWMLKAFTPAGTFLFFSICCVPVFFVLKKVPETKGKSLEEIESIWEKE